MKYKKNLILSLLSLMIVSCSTVKRDSDNPSFYPGIVQKKQYSSYSNTKLYKSKNKKYNTNNNIIISKCNKINKPVFIQSIKLNVKPEFYLMTNTEIKIVENNKTSVVYDNNNINNRKKLRIFKKYKSQIVLNKSNENSSIPQNLNKSLTKNFLFLPKIGISIDEKDEKDKNELITIIVCLLLLILIHYCPIKM